MPLPVLIQSEKTIAFLPDLPLDLTVLSYTICELTESTVGLRGPAVLRHIFRQPPDYRKLEYRLSSVMSSATLNTLKGISQYAGGRLQLNGVEFLITFIETDNLIFQLHANNNGVDVTVKVYDYNLSNEFDLETVEISFSRETPNGIVKLEDRHLEAVSRYGEGKPQINNWIRRTFKSDSITTIPYNRLIQVLFNIFKLTEQGVEILHFSKISNCPRCNNKSANALVANGAEHRYYRGLTVLAYNFKCGHAMCLGCILQLVKTANGVTKCHFCMQDLQHIDLSTQYDINLPNIKSLFIFYREPVKQISNSQPDCDFKTFKGGMQGGMLSRSA